MNITNIQFFKSSLQYTFLLQKRQNDDYVEKENSKSCKVEDSGVKKQEKEKGNNLVGIAILYLLYFVWIQKYLNN